MPGPRAWYRNMRAREANSVQILPPAHGEPTVEEVAAADASMMSKCCSTRWWVDSLRVPDTTTRAVLALVVFVISLFFAITIPMRIVFPHFGLSVWWYVSDYSLDLVLLLDIISRFFLGYEVLGVIVPDKTLNAFHYLTTTFVVDLLCVFPLYSPDQTVHALMRINRLGLLYRIPGTFNRWERATSRPVMYRIIKLIMGLLGIAHWTACIFFYIVRQIDASNGGVWPDTGDNGWAQGLEQYLDAPTHKPYMRALFWSTTLLTGMGPDHNYPQSDIELLFMFAILFIGLILFAAIIGNVGSLIANSSATKADHKKKMDIVNLWMRHKGIAPSLQFRIRAYYEYLWKRQAGLNDQIILMDFPEHLRALVSDDLNKNILREVPMFKALNNAEPFIQALMSALRPEIYTPGDYIVRENEMGQSLFFITRGIVDVLTHEFGRVAQLSSGQYFGDKAVLFKAKRNASIVARTYVDVFVLEKDDVDSALNDFPLYAEELYSKAAEELLKKQNKKDDEESEEDLEGLANRLEYVGGKDRLNVTNANLPQSQRPSTRSSDVYNSSDLLGALAHTIQPSGSGSMDDSSTVRTADPSLHPHPHPPHAQHLETSGGARDILMALARASSHDPSHGLHTSGGFAATDIRNARSGAELHGRTTSGHQFPLPGAVAAPDTAPAPGPTDPALDPPNISIDYATVKGAILPFVSVEDIRNKKKHKKKKTVKRRIRKRARSKSRSRAGSRARSRSRGRSRSRRSSIDGGLAAITETETTATATLGGPTPAPPSRGRAVDTTGHLLVAPDSHTTPAPPADSANESGASLTLPSGSSMTSSYTSTYTEVTASGSSSSSSSSSSDSSSSLSSSSYLTSSTSTNDTIRSRDRPPNVPPVNASEAARRHRRRTSVSGPVLAKVLAFAGPTVQPKEVIPAAALPEDPADNIFGLLSELIDCRDAFPRLQPHQLERMQAILVHLLASVSKAHLDASGVLHGLSGGGASGEDIYTNRVASGASSRRSHSIVSRLGRLRSSRGRSQSTSVVQPVPAPPETKILGASDSVVLPGAGVGSGSPAPAATAAAGTTDSNYPRSPSLASAVSGTPSRDTSVGHSAGMYTSGSDTRSGRRAWSKDFGHSPARGNSKVRRSSGLSAMPGSRGFGV